MDKLSSSIQTDVSLETKHKRAHPPIIEIKSIDVGLSEWRPTVKRGDAAMTHGMRTGLLRLKIGSEHLSAMLFGFGHGYNIVDAGDLNEHDLRDLGMLDGRVSPSTVERVARSDAWDIIGQPSPWL